MMRFFCAGETRKDVDRKHHPSQRGIGHMLHLAAQYYPATRESHLFAHMACHQFIVARDDLDVHAIVFERLEHLCHIRFGRIGKFQEAEQDQRLLIRYAIALLLRQRAIGHRKHTVSL